MVCQLRRNRYTIVRVALLAVAAGAVVAFNGLPAQARVFYPYPYSPYYCSNPCYGTTYYGSPYYGTNCQSFSLGPLSYSNCPARPYTYYTSPYYLPYHTPYPYYNIYGPYSPYPSEGNHR